MSLEPDVERVERIAKNDPEYMDTSPEALAATAFVTQYFIQQLCGDSLSVSAYRNAPSAAGDGDGEGPTLHLEYMDIADCVAVRNQYAFLGEMIPRTKNLAELVAQNKVRYVTEVFTPAQVGVARDGGSLASSSGAVQIDIDTESD
ncbi:Dls1p KNAG_0B05310 [Huiozyma naganishii CBS 8797]|uniref:Transcription factor CBF/NF-Y/archaeal histone domain-containing protein n=1 Tax=Huiozyma naganishii (strain ATCC MYA-139 / BCRC 22969 / CBS 8797 / KCTC 17520 / NBRC 10181 / NCYC 3082 / Yp74L-3) TaxID=1071383 RepID=J7S3Z2_HUIN7|nr:hypothetical protein KNAG_0B05310 [Kazachstania naganishii CBS 8797]CCK68964.1 hypothetical protein KNAG_0B05310 [Kazachstania naganishii CBS 8797]